MNTLYININGDDIQSADSIEVIGSKEDAIVNGFYYTLGAEILRGVNGIGPITKSSLITEFAKEKPDEYKSLEAQWEQLKCILLGEMPEGEFTITLPKEYLDWLQYNANPNYSEIYSQKYQGKKEFSFDIDVEELYEEIIDDPIRKRVVRFLLKDNNYRNFDQIVVNDNLVTRKSKFVKDIIRRFKDIDDYDTSFVRFENYKPISSQNIVSPTTPKLDEEEANISLLDQLFPIYGVKLGETTVENLEREGKCITKEGEDKFYEPEENIVFGTSLDIHHSFLCVCELKKSHPIPSKWKRLDLTWGKSKEQCIKILQDKMFTTFADELIFISPVSDFYIILDFDSVNKLNCIVILTVICPQCHAHHNTIDNIKTGKFECLECRHIWNLEDNEGNGESDDFATVEQSVSHKEMSNVTTCPDCNSNDIIDRGGGDYECGYCGNFFNKYGDKYCPECYTHVYTTIREGYMQCKCSKCGRTWTHDKKVPQRNYDIIDGLYEYGDIILGESHLADLREQGYKRFGCTFDSISNKGEKWTWWSCDYEGVKIRECDDIGIHEIEVEKKKGEMPIRYSELGFYWGQSEKKVWDILNKIGFTYCWKYEGEEYGGGKYISFSTNCVRGIEHTERLRIEVYFNPGLFKIDINCPDFRIV